MEEVELSSRNLGFIIALFKGLEKVQIYFGVINLAQLASHVLEMVGIDKQFPIFDFKSYLTRAL